MTAYLEAIPYIMAFWLGEAIIAGIIVEVIK